MKKIFQKVHGKVSLHRRTQPNALERVQLDVARKQLEIRLCNVRRIPLNRPLNRRQQNIQNIQNLRHKLLQTW